MTGSVVVDDNRSLQEDGVGHHLQSANSHTVFMECGGVLHLDIREMVESQAVGPVLPSSVDSLMAIGSGDKHMEARRCSGCGRRVVPAVDLGEQVVGRQRLGVNLLSLIATLREQERLPVAAIRRYLRTVHQLELSVGAIVAATQQVAGAGAAEVARIRERVRAGPLVHADETGWREAGRNGYAWTFCTPTERYFTWGGRDGGVVDAVLGDRPAGVLVTDFYAAYHHVRTVKQRCWSHLLRDAHEVRVAHSKDPI